MIARRSAAVLVAPLALLLLAGCSGQPVEQEANRPASPARPRLELKTESPTLHLLNGQQMRTAIVVRWAQDGASSPVTGTAEVDPPAKGVKAHLGPQTVSRDTQEVSLPLTLQVTETARAGAYVVTVSARDDSGAGAETRITVQVPPKY